jgi:hypothetical protein
MDRWCLVVLPVCMGTRWYCLCRSRWQAHLLQEERSINVAWRLRAEQARVQQKQQQLPTAHWVCSSTDRAAAELEQPRTAHQRHMKAR